jgi:hypothetical protein
MRNTTEITGEDLQKELDFLKEITEKIEWKDRWDSDDEYKYYYAMNVIRKIEEAKKVLRELLMIID